MVNRSKHPICKAYICNDCVFVFHISSHLTRKKPFCPNCGEKFSTQEYLQEPPKRKWLAWTSQESEFIDRIVKGELLIYQVVVKTGRSYAAVRRKVDLKKKAKAKEG